MPANQAVRPEDVLPDGADTGVINGAVVRKGSVAAFVANVKLLEAAEPGGAQRAALVAQIKALAPVLRTIGLLDVFEPRSA